MWEEVCGVRCSEVYGGLNMFSVWKRNVALQGVHGGIWYMEVRSICGVWYVGDCSVYVV